MVLGLPFVDACAGDWNQWRGSNRDGLAVDSPRLIDALPAEGLRPVWKSETIRSGRDGGWGSPAVADGKVYLFAHERIKLSDPGKAKFPWLAPEKRTGMSAEQYAEYEVNRRNEDEARAKAFKFRELIYCLDAQTGGTLWKNETDSLYSRFPQSGSATVLDGRLYILGAGLRARCLDAQTGSEIWNQRLEGEFRDEFFQSSIVIAEGVAVLVGKGLMGLDVVTGKPLWTGDGKTLRGSHSSPVVWKHDGRELIVVNVAGGKTVCLEPRTGKELWRVASEGGVSTPLIVGDRLLTYGNSRKKGLRCFDMSAEQATPAWEFHGTADKGSSPVAVGNHVFVQGERRLVCVNLETGRADWSTTLDLSRPQYTSLIAADGKVFYALEGLLCFDASPEGFEPLIDAKMNAAGLMAPESLFRASLGLDALEKEPGGLEKSVRLLQKTIGRQGPVACVTPAIADGRLYLRVGDGIVCYDLRAVE